jgi:hypothetical protein
MAAHRKSFARREAILPTRVLDTFGPRIARKRAVLVPGSNRDARFHVASLAAPPALRNPQFARGIFARVIGRMLEPSADEIRDWGNSVIQFMADYHASLRDRKLYRHMSSREIRDRLDPVLPIKRTDFEISRKS